MDQQPLIRNNTDGVCITMEKEMHANARSRKDRQSIQRALGFKNVVIYILVFINLLLCSKLLSIWSRQHEQQPGSNLSILGESDKPEHEGEDASTPQFWLKMALIVFLVLIGGVFAGLTIGLMGLDETNLHVLMASGSPKEQGHAETVYKLLSRGKHWVLVTLLLGNVIVNETLPVVLDSELGGGVVAILISTLLIVIFGEIIPQAVCARYGLAIGAYCAKPVLVFMFIMSPIAYPIAMLLDSWLGVHHGTTYRRTELKTLVSLHQVDGIGELTDDEVTIIASVLDLKEKSVSSVMTPLEDVFTLSEDAILDEQLMEEIVSAGYSRIPIYRHDDSSNFIGMLLVKRLITYDPEDHIPVRQFTINSLPAAAPNTSCLDILNFFQEGRSHMAIVTSEPGGFGVPVGVITLEDVIEELLGEEIVDESDVYVDVHNKIRVIRKPSKNVNMIKNLKSLLRSPALGDTTPLLGSGALPVDHTYMSTGKTIIQSRKSSGALIDTVSTGKTTAKAHTATPSSAEHPTKTSAPKNNGAPKATVNGNKDAPVVNFKESVDVKEIPIAEAVKSTTHEDMLPSTTGDSQERTVTIDMPEGSGTYLINPPEATAAADEATAETTAIAESEAPTGTKPPVVTAEPEAPVAAETPAVAKEPETPAVANEPETPAATEIPATTRAMPESESTSTLLTTASSSNAPSPSASKKKKKKKKSNK
ncbi:hypothetical protein BGZ51_001910 [Haplosporangium sp. Z 767]|nr:hypothetical protein BGZ50_009728 [Haplosporangium sp. Z 11]KAF9193924.1 hypothetical protein BGZ51_001910 [Haplosporangium sp. Z 767]